MLLGVLLVGALAACGVGPDLGMAAADVPVAPFQECAADEYAYAGETTLAALGISAPPGRSLPHTNRVGVIWITADRRPVGGEPGGPVEARMLCVAFSDDGGEIEAIGEIDAIVGFPVDDAWQPPGSREGADPVAPVTWQLLLVGLAAMLLAAGSLIAFRQRR